MQLKRWISLVGLMGAGKTSVGFALANELSVDCIDTDEEIEKAAAMSIAEIFARDGEAFFRQKEGQILARLLEGGPAIMSTGGGAFVPDANRELLLAHSFVVWLDADLETLWGRVKGKDDRPLLNKDNPKQVLADIKAKRDPIYTAAHLRVDAGSNASVPGLTETIINAAKAAGAMEP